MSTPGRSRLTVRQALRDCCLTVANLDDGASLVRYLDPTRGGLVVSSTQGINGARAIHAAFPDLRRLQIPRSERSGQRPQKHPLLCHRGNC